MSSKVNNKVPHTRVNSTGTSFAQAQAKMAIVRRSLFTPPFWIWSEENWVEDRNTWMNWHQTSCVPLAFIVVFTHKYLAPVVQTLDNAILRINLYPVDKY